MAFSLDDHIAKVKDFPIKGVLYYDITSVFINPAALEWCLLRMLDIYKDRHFDAIALVESRGFLLGAPFAVRRKLPIILVRKAGRLPRETVKASYELEYGSSEIEIHKDDIPQNGNILVFDDLFATGGTVAATVALLEKSGAIVKDAFGIIGLPFLKYQEKIPHIKVQTLINYDHE